jgi:hypothetical protein
VQFREVQGYESQAFLDMFGGSIKLLAGGIASAFNHVEHGKYTPKLIQIKGKKNVRMTEVPLDVKSLNDGDAFVLDNGLEIIQWFGSSAGIFEKQKAAVLVDQIKSERGKAVSRVISGLEDDATFWAMMGIGKPDAIPAATPDVEYKKREFVLYKVSDADGSMDCDEVATGRKTISKSMLDQDDVYLLDASDVMYCWVGKGANQKERSFAVVAATKLCKKENLGSHFPVIKMPQGKELKEFWGAFGAPGKFTGHASGGARCGPINANSCSVM